MPTPLIVTWSVESISKARWLLALNVDWLMLPAGNDSKPSVNVAPDVVETPANPIAAAIADTWIVFPNAVMCDPPLE